MCKMAILRVRIYTTSFYWVLCPKFERRFKLMYRYWYWWFYCDIVDVRSWLFADNFNILKSLHLGKRLRGTLNKKFLLSNLEHPVQSLNNMNLLKSPRRIWLYNYCLFTVIIIQTQVHECRFFAVKLLMNFCQFKLNFFCTGKTIFTSIFDVMSVQNFFELSNGDYILFLAHYTPMWFLTKEAKISFWFYFILESK